MALVQWNPATTVSRGMVKVGVSPAVVDITAPKLSEIAEGIGLDCSITDFSGTSTTDSSSVDWLCDPSSENLPGSTTHEIGDIMVKASGQSDQTLLSGLSVGDVVYLWRRDGLPYTQDLAVGQRVWVWRVVITSIDPIDASNTYIGYTLHVTAQARTPLPVAIGN